MTFLALGCTCFGGPVAHIGYFRQAFVERRRWLDEASFADLVALSQFLPGPASSQCRFFVGPGCGRDGWGPCRLGRVHPALGARHAVVPRLRRGADLGGPVGIAFLHGLKLVAVAIVAQAVWGMAFMLCPDRTRAGIALLALALVTAVGGAGGQIAAIVLVCCAGALAMPGGSRGDIG